jgi:hypothetical protein
MQVEEYRLPMTFARAIDVHSAFAYMGKPDDFLGKRLRNERTLRPNGVPH